MCGIYGLLDYGKTINKGDKFSLIKALGVASDTRGGHAAGISALRDGKIFLNRNAGTTKKNGVFDDKRLYTSDAYLGHTRYTTHGDASKNYNNHPFPSYLGRESQLGYTFAHNGVLSNYDDLAVEHKLPATLVETDSYIVPRMIDHLHDGVLSFENIRDVVEQIGGTFNFTFLDDTGLWLVRNNNPLTIIDIKNMGVIIYASTNAIIIDALKSFYGVTTVSALLDKFVFDELEFNGVELCQGAGDIIKINLDGTHEIQQYTVNTSYAAYSWDSYKTGSYCGYTPSGRYSSYGLNDDYYDEEKDRYYGCSAKTYDETKTGKYGIVYDNGSEIEVGVAYTSNPKAIYSRYLGTTVHNPKVKMSSPKPLKNISSKENINKFTDLYNKEIDHCMAKNPIFWYSKNIELASLELYIQTILNDENSDEMFIEAFEKLSSDAFQYFSMYSYFKFLYMAATINSMTEQGFDEITRTLQFELNTLTSSYEAELAFTIGTTYYRQELSKIFRNSDEKGVF